MKFFLPAFFVFLVITSGRSQTGTWTFVTTGNGIQTDVAFADTLYGWSVGDSGRIVRTTDGGKNWANQNSNTGNDLASVCFINRLTGFTVGNNGTLLRTTNGGMSWASLTSPGPIDWKKVYFLNSQQGWLAGPSAANIQYTSDGGANWNSVGPLLSSGVKDLWFLSGADGWAAGGSDLLHTVDGQNWNSINNASLTLLVAVSFPTDSVGYVLKVSFDGSQDVSAIFSTTDGGLTWAPAGSFPAANFHSIFFISPNEGWVAGEELNFPGATLNDGAVYHTTDAGAHWTRVINLDAGNYYAFINRIIFKDRGHGWIAGTSWSTGSSRQLIGRFTGPTTLVREESAPLPSGIRLEQNYPNPFNPSTVIRFALPHEMAVVLTIFDITGREIARPIDAVLPPGAYAEQWNAGTLPSGSYYYRLRAGEESFTKVMLLVK